MNQRVSVEIENHVAVVTLNRPEKRNAADYAMFEALVHAGRTLRETGGVRVVVLQGAGGHFCAGIDVSIFDESAATIDLDARDEGTLYQQAVLAWQQLPVPVVAAVDGVAWGAGLQIALGADIRVASPGSSWSIREIAWGLVPDMAITVTLRRVLAPDRLKWLAFTGRVVDGREAHALGLATILSDDPGALARELAAEISARSPDAVRAVKALLQETWAGDVGKSLRAEAAAQRSLLASRNQREAVAAARQQRPPSFSDPEA